MRENHTNNMPTIDKDIFDEASRCLNCKHKPCVKACPIGQQIPKFLQQVKAGDGKGAYNSIAQINPLGGICGVVCPHERQCQGSCVLGIKSRPLSIGKVEAYVCQNFSDGFAFVDDSMACKQIAVVGSGSAGLSAAWHLAKHKAKVTVFEQHSGIGGVLNYGIPHFRLDKQFLKNIVDSLQWAGVEFVLNCQVGQHTTLDHLSQRFDAVFVAGGLQNDYTLNIEGEHLEGVVLGNHYLKNPTPAKNVVVVGGGNVAMDCARTAKRWGANVTIAYRRSQKEMPACEDEIEDARQDGVQFSFLLSPKKIRGQATVEGVDFCVNRLVQTEAGERAKFVETDEQLCLKCDLVIVAVGSFLDTSLYANSGVEIANGRLVCDQNMRSTAANIFVGGDSANRANTVVAAAYDGKRAAQAICDMLLAE